MRVPCDLGARYSAELRGSGCVLPSLSSRLNHAESVTDACYMSQRRVTYQQGLTLKLNVFRARSQKCMLPVSRMIPRTSNVSPPKVSTEVAR